ncbi:MAG: HAD family hydrolase [Sedimentisphaerales bacterium]|nr:HAD family hydrolase [Sedimentisphaerales bacterium]
MTIKTVLFDLGETLVTYGEFHVGTLLRQAAQLTYAYIRDYAPQIKETVGFDRYLRRNVVSIRWRYLLSRLTNREFDGLSLLRRNLQALRIPARPEQLQELAWLWYQPAADLAQVEPELHRHLERLEKMSLQLAIVSNTFSPPPVLDRHLAQLDLLRFFPVRVYSSVTVYRKPHPRIFTDTLRRLDRQPAEAVMVGDRLREDIRGARRLGMRAVLRRGLNNKHKKNVKGVPVIGSIAELPDLIETWNRNPHSVSI